jgi:tyrosine-specific transport protein
MLNYLRALSILIGTIVGAGIFGLPYLAAQSGFLVVCLYFLLLIPAVVATHLLLGKVAFGTSGVLRFPGYVERYLGASWKKITFLFFGLGIIGASLAYLIVGGGFLKLIFAPYFGGTNLIYTLVFFGLGAVLIYLGIRSVSRVEVLLLAGLFFILIIFLIKAWPWINYENLQVAGNQFSILPYGVVLFSLWGATLIPEIKETLAHNAEAFKGVVVSGILISALTYLSFMALVLGVSGPNTSQDAISGLAHILGGNILKLGLVFGAIATFTSFITLGSALKKTLWNDFKINKNLAWLVTCSLPLALFLLGFRQLISVISLTGAVAIGFEGAMIVFLYRAFLKQKFSQKINPWLYSIPAIFVLGVICEIHSFLK